MRYHKYLMFNSGFELRVQQSEYAIADYLRANKFFIRIMQYIVYNVVSR